MKITYIHHSCFSVELEQTVLLFDYYQGTIPEFSEAENIFVFASHKHHDHFDLSVLELADRYPKIQFILSNDIKMNEKYLKRKKVTEKAWDKISYLGAGKSEIYTLGDSQIQVETLRSTDEGNAFIVECEGRTIYHAGDLNWWTWEGETHEEYEAMTHAFFSEIDRMRGKVFDAAFVPLDPRQKERYLYGLDHFMRKTQTRHCFPMHFWGDFSVIDRLVEAEESLEYRDRIVRILEEGETFVL